MYSLGGGVSGGGGGSGSGGVGGSGSGGVGGSGSGGVGGGVGGGVSGGVGGSGSVTFTTMIVLVVQVEAHPQCTHSVVVSVVVLVGVAVSLLLR